MKTLHVNVRNVLLENEKKRIQLSSSSSAEDLIKLLADDYLEYTKYGTIIEYKQARIFKKTENDILSLDILHFDLKVLSSECIQVLYELENMICSTIWIRVEDDWKAKFHQSTVLA